MLKVFSQPTGASAPVDYTFNFTSTVDTRAQADAIKNALTKAIKAAKEGNMTQPVAGAGISSTTTSAAMAIASAVSTRPGDDNLYDDAHLKANGNLQQSLLKSNPSLSKTFVELMRTKPEAIPIAQFTAQFWSSRIHLLRAHAIESRQTKASYNVLMTIKPKLVDEKLQVNVSKEKIQLIFNQHPIVRRVYDECVPKVSEIEFWSQFFLSRLFKKLKGERISDNDALSPLLDKYLSYNDDAELNKRLLASNVPHILDLEGNEQNHSQRKGNQQDLTMRPTSLDNVPIIRTLNNLSEKIMEHIPPSDVDPSHPIGMDEETFNTLALRDLQNEAQERRRELHIKDQSSFFSAEQNSGVSAEAQLFAKQDPVQVLESLSSDFVTDFKTKTLEERLGVNDDSSDSEPEEGQPPKKSHVGSKASRREATSQIMASIKQQREHAGTETSTAEASPAELALKFNLSVTIYDRLTLTHATSTEFLRHFWSAFYSGDPERADEITQLVETLERSVDRITAIGDDAEKEREAEIEKVKKQIRDHYEQTRRKLKFDPETVKGGRKVVDQLLGPTLGGIRVAIEKYREALAEELAEMGSETSEFSEQSLEHGLQSG